MKYICDYGCGQEAKFQFKNGKWCCSNHYLKCPAQRKKYSGENHPMFEKHPSEEVRKKISEAMSGKHCSEETRKKQRTSFEEIKKNVEDEGFKLSTTKEEYENHPKEKLRVVCPKGHNIRVFWNGKKAGMGCRQCADKRNGDRLRTSFEKIKKNVESEGFKLSTTEEEYENHPEKKLEVICPKGHNVRVFWRGKKVGIRCKECFNEKRRNPSQETRKKQRLARIRDIKSKHGQVSPNYNPRACKMMDKYGKEHGYNFQHAENGGEYYIKELGYWVDGYDKEKNVVIEVDEPQHFDKNGNLSKKDLDRQKTITKFLGCRFIRVRV